jgi:pyrimidine deaminase RibD-like protein
MIPTRESHIACLRKCLDLARRSPPKPSNFRVGAVLCSYAGVDTGRLPSIFTTGYTLELEGNTHAEQCALDKLVAGKEHELQDVLTPEADTILYTSLEPCSLRLSGNLPCVQRIIATRRDNSAGGIRKVVFGAKEPGTFVKDSKSCQLLSEAGIDWEYISDLEEEILSIAMEGHVKKPEEKVVRQPRSQQGSSGEQRGTNVDDISAEERKRQEALPRNPKKRMMEVDVPAAGTGNT